MRLSTIKLAGFKSFVDPTTLHFPTNMTGIVGPNGCGKSNVIDAVRWVMGESAASRLRGDALTDVIFSGSSARKPIGQASVELLFDNSDGAIGGEYAEYAELSVRRVVSHDGLSQYFLNGTRCRRRDVTDLFLGTGLGPRSYSIIEQGVISDIVESHPEQLRHHLEEAAGITKYKERRKETESRIRQTRENIDRIKDITEEVEKQLDHLNRQARAAERWQKLKDEHTRRDAELHALSYRAVAAELAVHSEGLSAGTLVIEQHLTEQRSREAKLELTRAERQSANETLEKVQADSYKVGAEIARIEQQARHSRELLERLQQDRQQLERTRTELSAQLDADTGQTDTLREGIGAGEPKLQALTASQQSTAAALQDAEAQLAAWQMRWQEHTEATSTAAQAAEVERTRIDYLDRQSVELGQRRSRLDEELRSTDISALDQLGLQLDADHEQQRLLLESASALLEQHKADHESVLGDERSVSGELNDLRQNLHTKRGRLASLEALQHAALGQDQTELNSQLQRAGLDPSRRLGSALEVDPGWELAVETVLHGMLEGVLVDSAHDWVAQLAEAGAVDLAVVERSAGQGGAVGTLAEHARGPEPALRLLAQVHCVEDAAQARQTATTLESGRSVISRQGEWFGPGFVRILRAPDRQGGVLAREREIQQLADQVQNVERSVATAEEHLQALREANLAAERKREDAQRDSYQAHRRLSELAGNLQGHRGKIETARARVEKLGTELAELSPRLSELDEQARTSRAQLETGVSRMGDLEQQRRSLQEEQRRLLEQREETRLNAREATEQRHQLALNLQSSRSTMQSLEQGLTRTQTQLDQLQTRTAELDQQLAAGTEPEADLERERQTYLDQRLLVDRQLVDARKLVEQFDATLREHEQDRQQREQAVAGLREAHAEQRLAEQALRLQNEQLARGIQQAGLDVDALLAELPEDADAEQWTQQLETLQQKIQRLEPVNLAAIQEHEEHAQRKQYLDAQMTDLNTALETLETAIRKIDRETRARFKETFDKVNVGLQQLFPQLFGGGHAYLEMTGDDLLNTGVAIMARPPGKRISNISLMSGGEKALCAVALVFAIFQLNPAPFCILDEVDAPLDEANVGRFSSMVLEMSEKVQFIFVTHNKATMEAAHQLCGVTMREPGVSRLVQVDLAEATKLAGAA